jgi:hypothetical protein
MDTLSIRPYRTQKQKFLEFFINEKPLSKLLDHFFDDKVGILDNWIGVLGSFPNKSSERIKVRQLLGELVTDKEIRKAYPPEWTEAEFQWYLERDREELSKKTVIIYYCAECGDYDCGGVSTQIIRAESVVKWLFEEGDRTVSFEFEKSEYYNVFAPYL